jgi:hypothetical protein
MRASATRVASGVAGAVVRSGRPAVCAGGRVGTVPGIHRSDDAGAGRVRIHDDDCTQHRTTDAATAGVPRVHGRVHVSTDGRGVVRGDKPGGG